MPADYRDELQATYDFILETQNAPESFRSFHWMISTDDHWRFADTSAVLGGPFDLSAKVVKKTPSSFPLDAMKKILAVPNIYVASIAPPSEAADPREVLGLFANVEPDRVLTVVAGGRRSPEPSGWSLKLVFLGLEKPENFLASNKGLLAATKPLVGTKLYSKRPDPT